MSSKYTFNGTIDDLIFGCFKTTRTNQFVTHRKKYDVHVFNIVEITDDGVTIKCFIDDHTDLIPFDDIVSLKNYNTKEAVEITKYESLTEKSVADIASICYGNQTDTKLYLMTNGIFDEVSFDSMKIERGAVILKNSITQDVVNSLDSIYTITSIVKY